MPDSGEPAKPAAAQTEAVRRIVVAIDGGSGVGKSTVSRRLAQRLELRFLDTGAMYRAIGLKVRHEGIPLDDSAAIVAAAERSQIRLELEAGSGRTLLDGEDVTTAIRDPEISRYASTVSAIPGVRRFLVAQQRQMGEEGGVVAEGRDIGTKVFPNTPFKFFLTADPRVRAERRCREFAERGTPQPLETVLQDLIERDANDSTRADSPLTCDATYTIVDTTSRSVDEVVELLEGKINELLAAG